MGLALSYFATQSLPAASQFHKVAVFIAVTLLVAIIYYSLMPKSDYMLNHLKTEQEIKAWQQVYTTMKSRYMVGAVLGAMAAVPVSFALCSN